MRNIPERLATLRQSVERVIRGKSEPLRLLLVSLLARGHVLIEDIPGVGKTTLARAVAQSISCTFRRIQLTSDMVPSDVLGAAIYDPHKDAFQFKPGLLVRAHPFSAGRTPPFARAFERRNG
ncbi:MAG: AAA family ATPase [Planctomycetes bacterium]|nr:AAA family ATPase [Planctomycetota bacterium]